MAENPEPLPIAGIQLAGSKRISGGLDMRLITSTAILVLSVLPALADRAVTEDERAKLVAAVQAEGCSGGKLEMDEDDQQFEVDDAVCADGKKYDLKFDMQMRIKRKNLD
ncbi:PepSY domain-containing protein [Bradyrhizobium sp. 157]|uniref:PepSY domain-containing protein n=1 Tax=Bradyrhizobium sp. 157 TaxID=2782631 RepID=UPI001FF7505B|nr:PepSY domain-containing protein [Bradyrhizobium sp. 157]MCK1636507.1 PepSY domain-containing protein [Bradyrhizobium sp. 157]